MPVLSAYRLWLRERRPEVAQREAERLVRAMDRKAMTREGRVLVAATAGLALVALLNLGVECWPWVSAAARWWANFAVGLMLPPPL
jgi:hypothetical protein